MMSDQLIRIIIEKLEEQSKLNVRTTKGYGVSHPFIDRKPRNLGKSKVREKFEQEEKENVQPSHEKVSISRAFSKN